MLIGAEGTASLASRSVLSDARIRVRAPGRVNLIGDHTDYTGGLVLPVAIDRFVDVEGRPGGDHVVLTSDHFDAAAVVPLDVPAETVGQLEPPWGRFVAAVVAELRPAIGFVGTVSSTVPVGAGLSSSAALEVAVAVALGASDDDPVALALLAQRAEHAARGVPTGIMDQLACIAGRGGHAVLIDCTTLVVTRRAVARGRPPGGPPLRPRARPRRVGLRRAGPRMRRRRGGDRSAADRQPRRCRSTGRSGAAPARPPRRHGEPPRLGRRRSAASATTARPSVG